MFCHNQIWFFTMAKFYIGRFDYGVFGLGTVGKKRYYFCRQWIGITLPKSLWYRFKRGEPEMEDFEDECQVFKDTKKLARVCFDNNQ